MYSVLIQKHFTVQWFGFGYATQETCENTEHSFVENLFIHSQCVK